MTTSFEVLKQANGIVGGLIAARTPPAFETSRSAYAALGELVSYASKHMDADTNEHFAEGINGVIAKLAPLAPKKAGPPGEEKKMTLDEFGAFFEGQVEKALAEDGAPGLQRLYAMQASIEKAIGSWESDTDETVTAYFYVDPWQQASVEREGDGPVKVTSGTAQRGEVAGTPGIAIADLMKSVIGKVEKAAKQSMDIDSGWSHDLSSPEFLHGVRKGPDFGRDFTK